MKLVHSVDQILADIDGVVPPEALDVIQEVGAIIQPQLDLIVALNATAAIAQRDPTINTHHLWFPRRSFVTGLERQFRKSFVIPLPTGLHNELHHLIEPPTKPNRATMLAYLSLMDKKEVEKDRESGKALRQGH